MKKTVLTALALLMATMVGACGNKAAQDQDNTRGQDCLPAEATASNDSTLSTMAQVIELEPNEPLEFGSKLDRPAVVDFNATWCGPCQQFKPTFEQASREYANRVDFYSVDVDKCSKVAEAYGVKSIPTILFVSKDGSITRRIGTMSYEDVDRHIQEMLK